jgi:hypothetical protein
MDNVFVGILSGENEGHIPTITLRAGTPPPSPPGTVTTGPEPTVGPPSNTITIDGEKGQILAGGARQPGSVSVLNPAGRTIVALSGSADALQIYPASGAKTVHITGDPDAILELFNSAGARTIMLDTKGGSGWFGGSGVDGDVLVFAAKATGTDSSQAAVWIRGDTGDVVLQNADCAEDFEVQENAGVEPGVVLTLSDSGPLAISSAPYDRKVAGIISGAGGLRPGIVLGRNASAGNRWPVALSGKVFCKVDADESPISVGDLLTTSSTPGHAMAARDHGRAFGAIIGKALAPLSSGQGLLPVLVALQ